MKFFLLVSLLVSNIWALDLEPGKWEMVNEIYKDGKYVNPMDEYNKLLEKMPKEQRAMMEGMMKKSMKKNSKFSDNTMKIENGSVSLCLDKKVIEDEKLFEMGDNNDCTRKVETKSESKYLVKTNCKDGTAGTETWNIKNSKHVSGKSEGKTKEGKEYKLKTKFKYIGSDCGDIAKLSSNLK